jgi:hypothetical protein
MLYENIKISLYLIQLPNDTSWLACCKRRLALPNGKIYRRSICKFLQGPATLPNKKQENFDQIYADNLV